MICKEEVGMDYLDKDQLKINSFFFFEIEISHGRNGF